MPPLSRSAYECKAENAEILTLSFSRIACAGNGQCVNRHFVIFAIIYGI